MCFFFNWCSFICIIVFFFFFKQKTAYEMELRLEFRRVLFRSREADAGNPGDRLRDMGHRAPVTDRDRVRVRTAHFPCAGRGDSYGDNPRKLLPLPATAHTASHLPVCSDGKRCAVVIEELVMRRPPVRFREAAPRSDGLQPLLPGAGGTIRGHRIEIRGFTRSPRTRPSRPPSPRAGRRETTNGHNPPWSSRWRGRAAAAPL